MSIFLVSTSDECKYKLCGIMTAPTNPSIAESAPLGIVGTSAPNKILETEG